MDMLRLVKTLNKKALLRSTLAALVTMVLVYVGSRNLQNFDPALITYLTGTVFAVFSITYRYTVWLQRPSTRLYWKRSLQFLFSRYFPKYLFLSLKLFVTNILFQRFIYPRGKTRWWGHFLLAFGCMLAFAITIPLTFGWIHFDFKAGDTSTYHAHLFGFAAGSFKLGSIVAFLIFHGLVWSAIMVIIGAVIMLRRRMTDGGLIATQTFEFDWIPLLLLIAISVTGLGISFDYTFLQGKTYQFMAVIHAVTVILFLIWLPFGKFFHIFQRLAQLGAILYRSEGERRGMAVCPHTGEDFAPKTQVDDLKKITRELGFDFTRDDGSSHLDLSPEGKRSAFARAHYQAREKSGGFFG